MRAVTTGLIVAVLLLHAACGGGGGGGSSPPIVTPPPPPQTNTVTIYYLRADPQYNGWGLHLWGSAIDASTATTWASPRMPDRIANDIAEFDLPIANMAGELNFIAHNGDLKSPVYDMSIVPQTFGGEAWLVQDSVASVSGGIGSPHASLAAAQAALARLGNASALLDLSSIAPVGSDSGLPVGWEESAAFIEIYVRGYQDSDGDGVGDLQGLISRLDYLQGLGIKGIWLMPVFESADNDHGYAVADYRAIESDYGTMADFEALLVAAHARGIAIIVDYVINHAASTNPLFLDATTGPANDHYDWFVWSDTRPTGWSTFAGDPWRNNGNGWYYAVFSARMPDWNLENPEVVAYHQDNLRFWLNKGVDGFRFDAVGVLFENGATGWSNQPENHVLLGNLQNVVMGYTKRYMVCEAPDDPRAFAAQSSCGSAFAFPVPGLIFASIRNGRVHNELLNWTGGTNTRLPLFLSNHDSFAGDRVWNQVNGDEEQYKLAAATYLLASPNPFTYYGEEVGMASALTLFGDHSLRTPMSWTGNTTTAGFTTATPFRDLSANVATHNVADEEGMPDSLLEYYRALLQLRVTYPGLTNPDLDTTAPGNGAVLLVSSEGPGFAGISAINYSNLPQTVFASTSFANTQFTGVFGASDQVVSDNTTSPTLEFEVPPRSVVVYVYQP